MKTVKIITAFLLASMLALSASAAEYIPSAEAYKPEVVVNVDPATEKEYHASIVDEAGNVVEYIFNDVPAQIVATFVDSPAADSEDRTFVSSEKSEEGAPAISEEIKQTIIAAEKELLDNALNEIATDFEAKWEEQTKGAPIENASLAKVFDITVPEEIKANLTEGRKVKFQFKLGEVTHEDNFVLLHKPTNSDKWIVEDYTIDDSNVITVELDEFSPFAVVIDKPVDPTPGQDSPQTGVAEYSVAVIACAVVLCGVAFVVIRKASKKSTAA